MNICRALVKNQLTEQGFSTVTKVTLAAKKTRGMIIIHYEAIFTKFLSAFACNNEAFPLQSNNTCTNYGGEKE